MPTDLSFTQINAAKPVGSTDPFSFDAANSDIVLSLKALTGNTYTGMANEGAIELVAKLLNLLANSQDAVNTTAPLGSRLNSFFQPSFGIPIQSGNDFYATATYTANIRIPLNVNSPTGSSV